jgi:hypothetical protein
VVWNRVSSDEAVEKEESDFVDHVILRMYTCQFTSGDVGTPSTGIIRFASVPWGYPLSFLDPLMIVVVDLDSVDRDDSPLPDDIVASIEQILVYLILGHLLQLEYETSRPIGNRPFHVAHVGLSRNLNLLYNSDDRIRLILTSFVSQ